MKGEITMNDYLDLFINEYESKCTQNSYRSTIQKMLKDINKEINEIQKIDLVQYKNKLKTLSTASQSQKIVCIKSYFKFLYDNDLIKKNPADTLTCPRIEHKPKDAMSVDEAISLMQYANDRERAIIAVFLNTGVRVQELIDMQMEDFINNPHEMILKTKRGKYRTIYLNDDTINLINKYICVRKNGCSNLFVSNQGTPLTESNLNSTWKKLARKSGVEKHITNHTFRATYVTSIAKDYGILMAQMAVGHSNIATTRIYVRGMEDEVKNVIQGLRVC